MGKRELFIALAFVAVAAAAYQMTAPPPKAGERGFSLSKMWDHARREMRGNSAQATVTSTGKFPASAALADLRFESVRVGEMRLRLIGEARPDITYELTVQSNGPDETTAREFAKRVRVTTDDLGSSLTMRLEYPSEFRQSASMVVRLPSRLGVLVSGANRVDVSDVANAHLEGIGGDCSVSRVAGVLSGTHRNGAIKIDGAGSVKLGLQRSRAVIQAVERGITLDARDGECRISNAKGPIEIDEQRADIVLTSPAGAVRVGGTDGRIVVTDPRAETRIDVRRAEVEVQLSAAVPLTLLTTEDTLRLILDGPPRVTLDALANAARIQATDFDLAIETNEREHRVVHAFGVSGAPRVSLRNTRGDIVIRKSAGPIVNRERK